MEMPGIHKQPSIVAVWLALVSTFKAGGNDAQCGNKMQRHARLAAGRPGRFRAAAPLPPLLSLARTEIS